MSTKWYARIWALAGLIAVPAVGYATHSCWIDAQANCCDRTDPAHGPVKRNWCGTAPEYCNDIISSNPIILDAQAVTAGTPNSRVNAASQEPDVCVFTERYCTGGAINRCLSVWPVKNVACTPLAAAGASCS